MTWKEAYPDVAIVDCHHHVGVDMGSGDLDAEWVAGDQRSRRAYLDAHGIDRCVIQPVPRPGGVPTNEAYRRANDLVAGYRDACPDWVAGACCSVHPADRDGAPAELERCFSELGMNGLSLHHRWLGLAINDPCMDPLLELVQAHGRTVFAHVMAESNLEAAWRLASLARRFPAVRFVALDAFSSPTQAAYICDVAELHPNLWFDTGCAMAVAHGLRAFLAGPGPERLVIGTNRQSATEDTSGVFPLTELARAGLDAERLALVGHRNLEELLVPAQ